MIIAVDGPSGSGKSTVCRKVSQMIGYQLLDTGAIYRCIALLAEENGIPNDGARLAEMAQNLDIHFVSNPDGQRVFINDRDVSTEIRTFEISRHVNKVSPLPEVRAALLGIQRRLGHHANVIVEGRDIGSVVFPDADLKVFYTASAEARAMRRMKEFQEKGETGIRYEDVVEQIRQRDETEYHRPVSPLIRCKDAVLLDTSELNFDESCEALKSLILAL